MPLKLPTQALLALTGALTTALAAFALTAAPAGAFGELTYRECIADSAAVGCSALSPTVLTGARGIAISPDGNSVYVVAVGSDAISHFIRNPDGTLTFADCTSSGTITGCDDIPNTPGPMLGPTDVIVSPDGKSVYVSAFQSNSLSYFTRAANGTLDFQKCWNDSGVMGCTNVDGTPLTGALGMALTPDGSSLYVTARTSDDVAHFRVNASGEPVYANCVGDDASDGCTDLATDILDGANAAAVTTDGSSLIVASTSIVTVDHFKIGAGGDLALSDCAHPSAFAPCIDLPNNAVDSPTSVATSPTGMIYTAGSFNNPSLAEFALDGNDKLSFAGCFTNFGGDCTKLSTNAFENTFGVITSPAGDSVYVTSPGDNNVSTVDTLAFFRADAGGRLTFDSCQGNTGARGCFDVPDAPLDGVIDAVVSPAGDSLYAVSVTSNSVSHFSRNAPPPAGGDTKPPQTTIDSGPKKKVKRRVARIAFSSSEESSSFTCTIDGGGAKPCNSPLTFRVKKKPRKHVFTVAATDASGNVDPTPASTTWKVKRKKKHHGHKHHHGHSGHRGY